MYKVKYGGKKGHTVELEESADLVAVRTKDNKDLDDITLSRSSQQVMEDATQVAKFPEAGITIIKVSESERPPSSAGMESTRGSSKAMVGGPPPEADEIPDTARRDAARATLKQEEEIRFAGRVLQDKTTGEVMLYTENFFVKFYDTATENACLKVIEKYNLTLKNKLPFAPNSYFVSASEGTGLEVFNISEKILSEKIVEYCHPELVQERRYKGIHPAQWHLDKTVVNGRPIDAHVNIQGAWTITRGKGITIAVVDDGVDMEHPEFAGRIVHPFDATESSSNARPKSDDDNHGTACAGMACAAGLQNGASGTAPEAFLMPIRLRSGLGSMAEANAFAWAADHGADVISCSWGPADGEWWNPADPLHNRVTMLPDSTRLAMEYALTKGRGGKGCVILFAAGNGNEPTANDGYIAYPGIIAVGACNDTGRRSVYSDFGDAVWVAFPSGDFAWRAFQHPAPLSEGLRTTDRVSKVGYTADGYVNSFGGTSGACPGMAGVVALMLAANNNLTPPEVKDLIRQSCVKIDPQGGQYNAQGHSQFYGYGRIDAAAVVQKAQASIKRISGMPPASVQGRIRFNNGETAFQHTTLMGNVNPPLRVEGIALDIPDIKDLTLKYKVNMSSAGIRENKKAGEYIGITSSRQKIMGIAFYLEGKAAAKYDIEYAARFAGETNLRTGKNGTFCGTDKKTGKTMVAISVTLKKK
jgi:subtilisin family serine protease